MSNNINTSDLFFVAINERQLKKNFIFYEFNEYQTKKDKKRTDSININDKLLIDEKLLNFYTNVQLNHNEIPISDGISIEKKICSHIEANVDNYTLIGQNKISTFICSIIQICKYYQRKKFHQNYIEGKRNAKKNLICEMLTLIDETLHKNELCNTQIETEKNINKLTIYVFILKLIISKFPFIIHDSEDNFVKCFNVLTKFRSFPNPIGKIGDEIFSVLLNECYLPGFSSICKSRNKSNEIFFLYSLNENLFDVSRFNEFTHLNEEIKIENVITAMLLSFNVLDENEIHSINRFDYIHYIKNALSNKKNLVQKLKSMIDLVNDANKYDKVTFKKNISLFNSNVKRNYDNEIQTHSISKFAYVEYIELYKHFKKRINKINFNANIDALFAENMNKSESGTIDIVMYESDFDIFIKEIQNKMHYITHMRIYILPNQIVIDNKITFYLSQKDILYNNLIYQPFTSIEHSQMNSELHIQAMKNNFNLYINDANANVALYFYKQTTSIKEEICFSDIIVINNSKYAINYGNEYEFMIEVFTYGNKLLRCINTNFQQVLIYTKNIQFDDNCEFELAEMQMNKSELVIQVNNEMICGEKITIKNINNENSLNVSNYNGNFDIISRYSIETIYNEKEERLKLNIITFC